MESKGICSAKQLRALAAKLQPNGRPLVLDGGLATELEEQGFNLDHVLWSGRVLLDQPDAITAAHRSFVNSGAQILTTATYQLWPAGLQAMGEGDWPRIFQRSFALARAAMAVGDPKLIAGSIGPFGATIGDGAEYRGNYGLERRELRDWHESRWQTIHAQQPDLILCETIPDFLEVQALAELAAESTIPVIISLSCADAVHLADGTALAQVCAYLQSANIGALGVNCCAPSTAIAALNQIADFWDGLLLAYPNRGELWQAASSRWIATASKDPFGWQDFIDSLGKADWWPRLWAVGGCCRISPGMVAQLKAGLDLARD